MRTKTYLHMSGLLALGFAVAVGCGSSGGNGDGDDDGEGGGGEGGAGGSAQGGKGGAGKGGGKGGSGTGGSGGAGGSGGNGGSAMAGAGGKGGTGGMAGMPAIVDGGADAGAVDAASQSDASSDAGLNPDAPQPPVGLLAWDSFDTIGRLSAASGGIGWGEPWNVQGDVADMPGYQIVNTMPLTYMNLAATPGYATGGQGYKSSGRRLNVEPSGVFMEYRNAAGTLGVPGKELWASFMVRRAATNNGPSRVSFHNANVAYWDADGANAATFAFGFFGESSTNNSIRYWGLRATEASTPVLTNVPVTVGETVFVVLQISVTGAGGAVKLFLNPTLGTTPPAVASAQVTMTTAETAPLFRNITFFPGESANDGAIDELRVGTSFASVTPTRP